MNGVDSCIKQADVDRALAVHETAAIVRCVHQSDERQAIPNFTVVPVSD